LPVPQEIRDAALSAFAQRHPSAVLLELVEDTFTADGRLPGAGQPNGTNRHVTFADGDLLVDVEVLADQVEDDRVVLRVRSWPARQLYVEVLNPHGDVHLRWGPGGPLDVTAPVRGPLSLLLSHADETGDGTGGRSWQTSWITL
jgi:hypothetical protein